MLTSLTRSAYHTLLDAVTLTSADDSRPAIIYLASDADPITVTRRDFRLHVQHYAELLHQMGIQSRDLVIIAHTQNLESIYAFWGAMLLGAIPSMFPTLTEKLDPEIYMRNLGELVNLSQVKAVLTTDEFAPTLATHLSCPVYGSQMTFLTPPLPVNGEGLDAINSTNIARSPFEDSAMVGDVGAQSIAPLREHTPNFQTEVNELTSPLALHHSTLNPQPSALALLQHSSGTTGLQKGVALSHEALLNQLASYADALELSANDVIVSWLPLYHDMGLIAGFLQPLVQGIPLVLMSPFDWVRHPALLMRAIHDYRGTLCWLPNFAYNHSAQRIRQRDSEGIDLSSMRAFINCSEPVFHESHAKFAERFAANGLTLDRLTVSYAMAENVFAVTQTPIGTYPTLDIVDRIALQRDLRAIPIEATAETAAPQVSCGKPIAGTQVKIVDERGATLAERQIGEVLVKSDCMLTGYYMRDDLQPFNPDGWYRTGDRGYLASGEVYIVGRSKDLIINAGKNVYPQDLEAIVNTVEGVYPGRAVVFGVPDAREGTELIAVVAEVESDDADTRKHIYQQIRQRVSRQTDVTVSYVELVERGWLIKTSSGKIARSQNRDKWLTQRETEN